ncbi:HlyD family secretion protein [Paraburkholderia sediminicola]|uniref:HlyD family secretion protein n=1 Tax=Paraburkholderia sediminicola TaxID=458836 RepID=UPI0038B77484
MNRKLTIRASAGMAVVLVLGGIALAATGALHSNEQSTDDAYVSADYTLVAPKVSGQIAAVLVEDNQTVRAGDELARIDDRDYQTALQTARAELFVAKARLVNTDARSARQQAMIGQASATIAADDASLTFAQQNAQRYRRLSQEGAGTTEQQQQADFTLRQQTAIRLRDAAALTAAQKELDVLTSERAEMQATVTRAQASVDQAKLNLSYTKIAAPVDGMIGQRSVRVGTYVSAGTTLLAVVPLHSAYIVGNFRETQLTYMHANQPARVTVDAFPDVVMRGHVESVAPATGLTFAPIAPDNATGNFTKVVQRLPVKIVLDPNQPDAGRLRVGMSVVPHIDTGSRGERAQ